MNQTKYTLAFTAIFALLFSMLYNLRAVSSISIIALFIFSLVDVHWSPLRIRLREDLFDKLRAWRRYRHILVFTLPFLIVLLSFWQTYDWVYWLIRMRIKLAFLLLPLAFLWLPRFSRKQADLIYLVFLVLMSITNLIILVYALSDWQTTIDNLLIGQPMWTPCDHIRYSLLLVTSILLGIYLMLTREKKLGKLATQAAAICTVTSFVFLHFLAVKSGLLVLYLTMIFMLGFYVFRSGRWLRGGVVLLGLAAMIGGLYYVFPTLQKKVAYTVYDFQMFFAGEGEQYSDSGRLAALDVGWEIARENLVLGVGAGNLRAEVTEKFGELYPLYPIIFMPPNQLLFVLAGTGLWGLLLLLISLFYPLWYDRNYRRPLLLAFFISQLISITIEHALENTVGIFHFLLFMLLILSTAEGSAAERHENTEVTK